MKIINFVNFETEVELLYQECFEDTSVLFDYGIDLEKVFLASLANDPDMLEQLNKICGTNFNLNTDVEDLDLKVLKNSLNYEFDLTQAPPGSHISICDHIIYLLLDQDTLNIKNFDCECIMFENLHYSGPAQVRVYIDTFRTS